jgi:hypothetical protein
LFYSVISLAKDAQDDAAPVHVYTQRALQNIAVPSHITTPVVLTPGVPSPVSSFTQGGKWTDLDLDKFYDDDDSEDDSEEEEEESGEDIQDTALQETTAHSDDGDESEDEDSEEASEDDGIKRDDGMSPSRQEDW